MNYMEIKKYDVANGPGVRTSLFVSGCTHHCKGCFNPESWDFKAGKLFDDKVIEEVIESLKPDYIKGLTLLGGEPFEPANQQALLPLLKRVKEEFPNKSIWAFSGYLYDKQIKDIMMKKYDFTKEFVSYIDVLVDGEFHEEEKDLSIIFRGSRNQRIIDIKASELSGSVVLHEKDKVRLGGNTWNI